jgi:hypothetical protein
MSQRQSPKWFEAKAAALRQGLLQHLPPSAQEVILGGKKMPLTELHRQLEEMENQLKAVHLAQSQHHWAVVARREAMPRFHALYEDAVLFVRHLFGRESTQLQDFGIKPHRPRRQLSAEAKAIARAKAAATRHLRGTRSRKQREAITLERPPVLQVLGPSGKPLPGQEPTSEAKPPAAPEPESTDDGAGGSGAE